MSQEQNKKIAQISTGIPGYDEISFGGLPTKRASLVVGTSGSAKTIFMLQVLAERACNYNEPSVFVTFEETVDDIHLNVDSFSWDLKRLKNKKLLEIVDLSPDLTVPTIEVGNYDLSATIVRIMYAVESIGAKHIFIDSIGAMFTQVDNEKIVRRELFRLITILKQKELTVVVSGERPDDYGAISRYGVEEFLSDTVIILRNVLTNDRRRRSIEIYKSRGVRHKSGEFTFTINQHGIVVIPLSIINMYQKSTRDRISTGNKNLDTMTNGGFFRNTVVLVNGPSGVGKTLISNTFLADGCEKGEKSILFTFEESAEQVISNAKSLNIDLQEHIDKENLMISAKYPEAKTLEDHYISITNKIKYFNPSRIVLDSITALEYAFSDQLYREFIMGLTAFIKQRSISVIYNAASDPLLVRNFSHSAHISALTDSVIMLKYVENGGEIKRCLSIIKMRGTSHDHGVKQFFIDDNGYHIGEQYLDTQSLISPGKVDVK